MNHSLPWAKHPVWFSFLIRALFVWNPPPPLFNFQMDSSSSCSSSGAAWRPASFWYFHRTYPYWNPSWRIMPSLTFLLEAGLAWCFRVDSRRKRTSWFFLQAVWAFWIAEVRLGRWMWYRCLGLGSILWRHSLTCFLYSRWLALRSCHVVWFQHRLIPFQFS